MTDDQALRELQALVQVPGALKIIRWQLRDGYHTGDLRIARPGVDVSRPEVWEWSDVDQIAGPDARGLVTAYSAPYQTANGRTGRDETTGRPAAVLSKLQEWRQGVG